MPSSLPRPLPSRRTAPHGLGRGPTVVPDRREVPVLVELQGPSSPWRPYALGVGGPPAQVLRQSRSARRSPAVIAPHMPSYSPLRNAQLPQSVTTGQRLQTARACSICSRDGPSSPIGKKSSGSSERHAARSRQFTRCLPGALPHDRRRRHTGAGRSDRQSERTSPQPPRGTSATRFRADRRSGARCTTSPGRGRQKYRTIFAFGTDQGATGIALPVPSAGRPRSGVTPPGAVRASRASGRP